MFCKSGFIFFFMESAKKHVLNTMNQTVLFEMVQPAVQHFGNIHQMFILTSSLQKPLLPSWQVGAGRDILGQKTWFLMKTRWKQWKKRLSIQFPLSGIFATNQPDTWDIVYTLHYRNIEIAFFFFIFFLTNACISSMIFSFMYILKITKTPQVQLTIFKHHCNVLGMENFRGKLWWHRCTS